MGRLLFLSIVACLATMVQAETLVAEAKILEITERGFILKVGTEPLAVEDSPETRLWKDSARTDRSRFRKDDSVGVRIKTDTDPPVLREMADAATWAWLNRIRKEPQKAVVEKVEAKTMRVKLADGRPFEFRISDKTEVLLGGRAAGMADLEPGATVYVKGRLLPTLDTWLEKVTDAPIAVKAPASKAKKAPKLEPLPTSGRLEGDVLIHLPPLKMFDVLLGVRTLHITYRSTTKFSLDGKASGPGSLTKGQRAVVHYTRDKTGRIFASKVDLFSPKAG
jgi:hypothetical protein